MPRQDGDPSDNTKKKRALAKNIVILASIVMIGGAIALLTGAWLHALFFICIAWPTAKIMESIYSRQLLNAKSNLFVFFDSIYEKTIKPTRVGKLLEPNRGERPLNNNRPAASIYSVSTWRTVLNELAQRESGHLEQDRQRNDNAADVFPPLFTAQTPALPSHLPAQNGSREYGEGVAHNRPTLSRSSSF